jgi:hypothetical protein
MYPCLSVICAAFLWSVPIDKTRLDVLDHIRNLLGQFIIWHALTNADGYVLWRNRARSMSVVANENNDVTMFREVNCKMRLFAMKYSIEFEEKINWYNSLFPRQIPINYTTSWRYHMHSSAENVARAVWMNDASQTKIR